MRFDTTSPRRQRYLAPTRPNRRRAKPGEPVAIEPSELTAPPRLRPVVERQLAEAAQHYAEDRYAEALRILTRIERLAPASPPIEELLGLVRYRLGDFARAARHLATFVDLTGDLTHGAILMDCARAEGDAEAVEHWWRALREASPSKDAMVEGRIVWASHLADTDRLSTAVDVIRRALERERQTTSLRALRLRYQLATLLERQGRYAEARDAFRAIAQVDPSLYDVAERLAALA
ncbi:Tetratricopeptide TPR_2 repeat protein [Acidimicrobium ferrooxidans DSM 10331]|uniref:Tetratricopeptide TPR_2 repeat protein n=1 Tax=Acidimicrobium ferrooxidans (strain DSM 10331 / JCM 15462 / NBRC 103882 / ICP) TaxID=525909 RepID=C7LYN3_ACIFD|nr:tetratricopeptide repeat protein [Acidimicrobium ferrooxidans]ACU53841.1 Tetratricopeptide TPR_2 repeat protein [Acidimicrobium ferrooxidans DSM 10331]